MLDCWAADWWRAAAALTAGSVGGFCSGVTGPLHKQGMGILLRSLLWGRLDFHCSSTHHLNVGEERLFLASAASVGPAEASARRRRGSRGTRGRCQFRSFDLFC